MHLHQIQENWAGRNFLATSRMNSLLITYTWVQRWNWNLQLPTSQRIRRIQPSNNKFIK